MINTHQLVQPTLKVNELAALVKFLECSYRLAIDTSVFTEQESNDICQGYLSLREQLEGHNND